MGVNIYRFSSLPNSLLSTIFSPLSFKEVARTSILSKNWVNISKVAPNIEFNELFFVKFDQSPEIVDAQRIAFLDFMEKWIKDRAENVVNKLSLTISVPEMFKQVIDQFVASAVRNGVKYLELDFTHPTRIKDSFSQDELVALFDLPSYVYDYGEFESLKLYACDFVTSGMVNFHSLKEISLGCMKVKLCAIKALLADCEKLESLSLFKCWNSDAGFILKEEYSGLKKLVINRCQFNTLNVNAPNLKVFIYQGLMTLFVVDIQSTALDEVNLDFSLEHGCQVKRFADSYLYYLLLNVFFVRKMTVCSYLLQVIYTQARRKKLYRKMSVKHLIMKTALHKFEFMGISFMLKSCPDLERLTIEIVDEIHLLDYDPIYNVIPERYWEGPANDYKCVKFNLKEIEINGFKGTENEFTVIKYFLMRGKALRKVSINLLKDDVVGEDADALYVAARCEVEELLSSLPKASTNLKISIY